MLKTIKVGKMNVGYFPQLGVTVVGRLKGGTTTSRAKESIESHLNKVGMAIIHDSEVTDRYLKAFTKSTLTLGNLKIHLESDGSDWTPIVPVGASYRYRDIVLTDNLNGLEAGNGRLTGREGHVAYFIINAMLRENKVHPNLIATLPGAVKRYLTETTSIGNLTADTLNVWALKNIKFNTLF